MGTVVGFVPADGSRSLQLQEPRRAEALTSSRTLATELWNGGITTAIRNPSGTRLH